jgi:hypothetical protein
VTDTILVLTEDTLAPADVSNLISLHPDETLVYRVLVPADTERNLLVSLIDQLSLGELRLALDTVLRREPMPRRAKAAAADQLAESLAAFAEAGREATGEVVADDPLPALQTAVATGEIREVAIVTYPHAVEDTFHTDWASRARDVLKVPVLHLYSGTSELG